MKQQIRGDVFESASSAVHSFWCRPKMCKNHLRMKDGYVIADFGQFGKEEAIYIKQNDKLSYLLTELYYINHWQTEGIEDMYQFRYIEEAIKDYDSSVLGIKIKGKVQPELDHQVFPEYGESRFVNYWDKKSIQRFLFNSNAGIETDSD